ncbi:ATP-binding cassette domain-containing protein [Paenimyroides tangerinum]|uniref:ATP-binding cassette domain-containing protein n=1 Tax=Paenimyroides tangerinum TaxID=2488728 RepID=A0A3P3W4N6_9FLAO|nr:ABC transporter transmembrane domain-containing protein [Paenimyroides tangerinum]RRJ90055.1 ATP-binding cassette domain-containing protein [Paenimyroides tangerinum]
MDDNLKKIIPYTKKYKKNVVLNIVFNVLYALFSTISMIFIFPVLQVLFKEGEKITKYPKYTGFIDAIKNWQDYLFYYVNEYSNKYGVYYGLMITVSLVLITFLLKNLSNYFALQNITKLRNGVLRDLREKMYNKIVSLPVSYYSEKRKGDVMSRMLGDINEVQASFFLVLELIIKEPLTILFALVSMFFISWKLTLFVFVFIPISALIITKIGKTLKAKSTKAQQENGYLISITEETLSGLKVVKAYNAETYFSKLFKESIDRLFKISNSIAKKNNLAQPMSEFLGIVIIGVLLVYGGNLVLVDKSIKGAEFLTYIALAYNILTPAKAFSKASYQVKNGLAAADRVFEILEVKNPIEDNSNAKIINSFDKGIEIKNVTFAYNDDAVLKNFTLDIPKGKTIALVGQSGSGKSTIANLLTRFYDVNQGELLIDGENIKNISLHSLRDQMGLVTQDSIMFNGSIADNVKLGKLDANDEEVIQALKVANAYEFVANLPEGIHTNIGDAGNKLSGGQKQRISIARAILKNPPIMILDEATSALDTESERLVQDALEKMMQNRTSVVIAHRLSTIQKADNIVVMNRGQIVEQGTHDELLAKNGTYAKLVSLQSFES